MTEGGLPAHLESHLGPIHSVRRRMHFAIVTFSNEIAGGVPYMTVGLSRHVLQVDAAGETIRQELLMLVPRSVRARAVVDTLEWFGLNLIREGAALARGEVVNSPRPVIPKTDKVSLYAASPVYLPDEFAEYEHPAGLIVIAWLIPITGAESAYVVEHGAPAFEEHLVRTNPDLVDVRRPSSI